MIKICKWGTTAKTWQTYCLANCLMLHTAAAQRPQSAFACRRRCVHKTMALLTQQHVNLTGLSVCFKVDLTLPCTTHTHNNIWDCLILNDHLFCCTDVLLDPGFEAVQSTFCQKHCHDFEVRPISTTPLVVPALPHIPECASGR